jgi:AICAR transformylase/IMP cyclohydrolase PurH
MQTALLSVYGKTDLLAFAKGLHDAGVHWDLKEQRRK